MRVLAVADVYEALTAERPYRPPYAGERALEIMRIDVPGRLAGDAFAALEQLLETHGGSTGPAPSLSQTQRHTQQREAIAKANGARLLESSYANPGPPDFSFLKPRGSWRGLVA
jgi:HD-GYP domain-containing protein (c-di-GMP phosphodiesterase class II)